MISFEDPSAKHINIGMFSIAAAIYRLDDPSLCLKIAFIRGNIFRKKYFPFTASLALQMLGFYKELWLSGAVSPARRSDDPWLCLKMTVPFILGKFCYTVPFILGNFC